MSQSDLLKLPAGCSFPRGTRLIFTVEVVSETRKVHGGRLVKLALPKRMTSAEVVAIRDTLHRAAVIHVAGEHANPLGFVSRFSHADYDEDVTAIQHTPRKEIAA
jgi:hypothetical protein